MRNNIFAGVAFNGKHSYRDYGMFLSEPPDFGVPEPKIQTIDIPGRDGALDFTEAATGEVKYNNRQMTFTFATEIKRDRREALRSELMSDLHGRVVDIIYDFDANWYYTGRCSVSFEDVLDWKMKIVITVDANPYKLAHEDTIITVSPSDFAEEVISLGKGKEAQKPNSIWTFGTKNNPQLDLTQFDHLRFWWSEKASFSTAPLQLVDGDGNVYNTTINGSKSGGVWQRNLSISSISGIDKTRVYRILAQNRPMVNLDGYTLSSATVKAHVSRMTVVPVWSASAQMDMLVNGEKFSLPLGETQNYNIRLHEGENQITLTSASENETVSLRYRNGRL